MKKLLVSLFVLFSSFAAAEDFSLLQSQPAESEQTTFAEKINTMVLTLTDHDKKVIREIQNGVGSNDSRRIGYLMSKQTWKGIRNQNQRRFWAAVLYIAFNYVNEVSCNTRNFWFLSKSRMINGKSTLIKKSACEKQLRQTLTLGGISRNLHSEITEEYCAVLSETWILSERAAIAYNKAVESVPYLCR